VRQRGEFSTIKEPKARFLPINVRFDLSCFQVFR
jgi:hypothetical protein